MKSAKKLLRVALGGSVLAVGCVYEPDVFFETFGPGSGSSGSGSGVIHGTSGVAEEAGSSLGMSETGFEWCAAGNGAQYQVGGGNFVLFSAGTPGESPVGCVCATPEIDEYLTINLDMNGTIQIGGDQPASIEAFRGALYYQIHVSCENDAPAIADNNCDEYEGPFAPTGEMLDDIPELSDPMNQQFEHPRLYFNTDGGIDGNGTCEFTRMYRGEVLPPGGCAFMDGSYGDDVEETHTNNFTISEDLFKSVLERPGCLLTEPGVLVPSSTGFMINDVDTETLLEAIGLETGDVFVSINTLPLTGYQDAGEAMVLLQNETEFTLVVKRNNVNVSLHYEIE